MRTSSRVLIAALAVSAIAGVALAPASAGAQSTCTLGNGIKHVIIIQFDNTHSARDNSSVPSDLEQIPALRSFITSNGTLLTNDHTVLISHTAGGIVSTETGLYPDRNGVTVSNSYQYFDPTVPTSGNVGGSNYTSAFKYWTDPVGTGVDKTYNNDTTAGKNTPGPWVPFTRAGCDFAGLSAANMELENTTSDLASVFPGFNFGTLAKNATNLEGIAIHCSKADSTGTGVCAHGQADNLPNEPTGYSGYKGLFGAFQVYPVLAGKTYTGGNAPPTPIYDAFAPDATNKAKTGEWHPAPVHNLPAETTAPPASFTAGTTSTSELLDGSGASGFPGFGGQEANNALGETAAAQEAGIPVTYAYISDAHDDHYNQNNGNAFGPGQAGYVKQLKEYNAAFQAFFLRLANEHIDKSNTLFLFTVDEGDHFAGAAPTNPGCDGVTVGCRYSTIGEVDTNLNGLVLGNTGDKTVFDEHYDDAPTVHVKGQPGPDAANVRQLEREMSGLSQWDPNVNAPTPITSSIAIQAEEQILHMWNADPLRRPTFTLFGNPDFYFTDYCSGGNPDPGCWSQNPGYAWNHGDAQPEIASTWQGWVGPGVQNYGVDAGVWTDHTDARPTLLSMLHLADHYNNDGRVISQILTTAATPAPIAGDVADYNALSTAYKQLDAPFGQFAHDSLAVSTKAVTTTSASDATYKAWESQLTGCENARTPLVASIDALLTQAAFNPSYHINPLTAQADTQQANQLITDMSELAAMATPPSTNVCTGHAAVTAFGPVADTTRAAHLACQPSISGGRVATVACSGVAAGRTTVVSLSQGRQIVGWGVGLSAERIPVHQRRTLHGVYRLTVTVIGGGSTLTRSVRL